MHRFWRPSAVLIPVFLSLLVYWPGLGGGFLFDDFPTIVTNSRVQPDSLDWSAIVRAAGAFEPGFWGRPLAMISFAIDHVLWGQVAWGFKLTNVLIHALNTVLVLFLADRLLSLTDQRSPQKHLQPSLAALAVSAFWALHPLQVSTVLYVVQRMELLTHTFVLLALLSYLTGRIRQIDGNHGWPWILASVAFTLVGFLSKETAILVPLYTLALEWTLLNFRSADGTMGRRLSRGYVVLFAGGALILLVLVSPRYLSPEAYQYRDFNVIERLLSQPRILTMYLGQILAPLPSSLTFYYDNYDVSRGLLSPASTVLALAFVSLLLLTAFGLRRALPLTALGVLWFLAGHSATSSILPLELVFEHRNYFALLGIALVLADAVRRIPTRDGPFIVRVGVVAVLIGFGVLTIIRASTWGDPLLLASDLVARNPESPRASNDLATLYVGISQSDPSSPFFFFGAKEFERGSRLQASSPLPEQGLILMHATTEQPVKAEWWDSLIYKLEHRAPGPQELLAVTGLVRERSKGIEMDDEKVALAYSILSSRRPLPAHVLAQFGDHALTHVDDYALAERMFMKSVARSRSNPEFVGRVASVLIEDGQFDMAHRVVSEAVNLGILTSSQTAKLLAPATDRK